eukprot:TRINITY_DN4031_c0_g1_i1.p1 TRINITY_DN4031_c0_g1~~TRINITY_DN4031_c0_g1_i1.p1  ORF type:complete len:203 (-),score=26.91 TRINITY_DN4031_c0_g1_i1:107-715(-)
MDRKKKLLKVILLGDTCVGKTSLMTQYVNQRVTEKHKATIGADFLTKDLVLEHYICTLQIWDTAGQEQFKSLGSAFYRGSDCCALVFDLTDETTFRNLNIWREDFVTQGAIDDETGFPFILIGNKADLVNERKVSKEKALEWCEKHNSIPYFETSAMTGVNIEEAFQRIAEIALSYSDSMSSDLSFPLVNPIETPASGGGCC